MPGESAQGVLLTAVGGSARLDSVTIVVWCVTRFVSRFSRGGFFYALRHSAPISRGTSGEAHPPRLHPRGTGSRPGTLRPGRTLPGGPGDRHQQGDHPKLGQEGGAQAPDREHQRGRQVDRGAGCGQAGDDQGAPARQGARPCPPHGRAAHRVQGPAGPPGGLSQGSRRRLPELRDLHRDPHRQVPVGERRGHGPRRGGDR